MYVCVVCGKEMSFDDSNWCSSCNTHYCFECYIELKSFFHRHSVDVSKICKKCGGLVLNKYICNLESRSSFNETGLTPLSSEYYERQEVLRREYQDNVNKWNEELRRQYR